jgi:hypothetical protein
VAQCGPRTQRCLNQLFASGGIAAFGGNHPKFVSGGNVVGINFEFPLKCLFRFLHLPRASIFRTQLFMEPGLIGSEVDGRVVFSDRIHVAFRVGIGFGQDLAHSPRFGIRLEHTRIAVL